MLGEGLSLSWLLGVRISKWDAVDGGPEQSVSVDGAMFA